MALKGMFSGRGGFLGSSRGLCWVQALLSLSFALAPAQASFAAAGALPTNSAAAHMSEAQDEAVKLLKQYLQINTTNPPGNETKGAEFLAKILNDNGIEAKLFETAAGRSCVYARLKSTGKKRPIILLNHIDVVPAEAKDWKHAPFGGDEIDGEIWGRGTLDMKGFGIAELEAMLLLKRYGVIDRDIIFLATPDEEIGGTYGAAWFVKNHPELVKDAEYLFNEGSFIDTEDGKPKYWGIAVSEKSVLWLSLTAKGDPGHASMPMPDSSVNRLVRSVNRIVENPPKPSVLAPVREYFKRISPTVGEPLRSAYSNIDESVNKPTFYAEILKDKFKSPMLRNTISPTVLKAGYKTNVIPAEATAELDCRLLPGTNKDEFIANLKDTMKDPTININVLDWVHTDASPYETECFSAISRVAAKELPGVPVVPMVMPWFTDSHWFRDLGIASYGCMPFKIDAAHLATMHGNDERIPTAVYRDGVKLLYQVLDELCSTNPGK